MPFSGEKEIPALVTDVSDGHGMMNVNILEQHAPLGRGSYGIVLVADWMGVPVAVKRVLHEILPKDLETKAVTGKAEDEAKLLRELRHPNLIQCFGRYYDDRDRLCIVIELMERSLTDLLKQTDGPLSMDRVYDISLDITSALRYLHSSDVSHRDITPNNVLLSSNGKAKLSDLGGAKQVVATSPIYATRQPGTPIYMPPEALVASKYTPTSVDIYSLGVVLLEMSSGENPKPVPDSPYKPCSTAPGYKGAMTFYLVPEIERRSKCFSKLSPNSTIKAIVLACLSENGKDRPPASQVQDWFLQIKRKQIPVICDDSAAELYDDTHKFLPAPQKHVPIAHRTHNSGGYVNVTQDAPPLPPKPKKVQRRASELEVNHLVDLSEDVHTPPSAASVFREEHYQPLIKRESYSEYEPMYVDGNKLEENKKEQTDQGHQFQRGRTVIHSKPPPIPVTTEIRPRADTTPAYPIAASSRHSQQQANSSHGSKQTTHRGPVYISMSPQQSRRSPQQAELMLNQQQPANPVRVEPDLPLAHASKQADSIPAEVEHVYESLDSKRELTVLRANPVKKKKSAFQKKSPLLHTSENELLITDNKDAGPTLKVKNHKGTFGDVHQDQVTRVDPVDVAPIPGNPWGILHRILTSNKKQPLQSGIKSKNIIVTYSGSKLVHGGTDTLLNIGSNEIVAAGEDKSGGSPFFQIDLSKHRLLHLTGFRLQCSALGTYKHPVEWEMLMSIDGKEWASVGQFMWDDCHQGNGCWCFFDIDCDPSKSLGRLVKIVQTNKLVRTDKLCLSGVEFYGQLYSSIQEELV